MWIRTQDKKRLMNINDICVSYTDGVTIGTTTNATCEESFLPLGIYKSEERALRIIDLIQEQLEKEVSSDSVNRSVRTVREKVFQMPRE